MSIIFEQLSAEGLTQEEANEASRKVLFGAPAERQAGINFLVERSLREAVLLLRGMSKGRLNDGELVSIAYKALERSARSYSPKYGKRFFYFAKKALRGVLIEYFRGNEVVKHAEKPALNWEEANDASSKPKKFHPDVEDTETTSELEGRSEADFSAIYRKEDFEQVLKAMKCLNKFERGILMFIRATGYSFRETAEEFGCSRAWVGLCYNRAIEKLRAVLAPHGR